MSTGAFRVAVRGDGRYEELDLGSRFDFLSPGGGGGAGLAGTCAVSGGGGLTTGARAAGGGLAFIVGASLWGAELEQATSGARTAARSAMKRSIGSDHGTAGGRAEGAMKAPRRSGKFGVVS